MQSARYTAAALALAAVAFGLLYVTSLARAQDLDKPVFVVALEKLEAGPYARAVMLAVPAQGGHVGVVLNKPSKVKMAEVFPDDAASQKVLGYVYFGGIEHANAVVAMVRAPAPPSAAALSLMPGVWLLHLAADVDQAIATRPNEARYYAGIVGWPPGQLAEEISKGFVAVVSADPEKLFLPDTSKLYEQLLPFGRGAGLYTRREACPC